MNPPAVNGKINEEVVSDRPKLKIQRKKLINDFKFP